MFQKVTKQKKGFLKKKGLKDFYILTCEKFNNKQQTTTNNKQQTNLKFKRLKEGTKYGG